ncbi:MAG: hypothetical protein AB1Z98_37795 [Nannocystaceae bacterium]
MRSPGVWVLGAAAAAVLGYAFYTVLGSERPAPERVVPDGAADAASEPAAARARPSRRPGTLGVKPAPVTDAADSRSGARPRPGPPPRPEPTVSLEVARSDFQAILDELDEVARSGRTLTTSEWTDYYKQGNDALVPLLQHLSWSDEDDKPELQRANEDLRAKLRAIEPGNPGAAVAPAAPPPG